MEEKLLTSREMYEMAANVWNELMQTEFEGKFDRSSVTSSWFIRSLSNPPDSRQINGTFLRVRPKDHKWFFSVPYKFSCKPTWTREVIASDVEYEWTEWETCKEENLKKAMRKALNRWILLDSCRVEYNNELKNISNKWAFRFSTIL